jgi:hypothetical protein
VVVSSVITPSSIVSKDAFAEIDEPENTSVGVTNTPKKRNKITRSLFDLVIVLYI